MITQTENAATIAANADFIARVADYKALLTAEGLPVSIDVELLKTTLRTQLFQKLLSADKGLKMRWDMLKSQDARLKLIGDTIDLTGYEVVDTIAEAVKGLEMAYKKIYTDATGHVVNHVPFAQFASVYGLDLAPLLDAYTFDWAGKEHVLEYFQALSQHLYQLRDVMRAAVATSYTLGDVLHVLPRFYTPQSSAGEIVAREGVVMTLAKDLEQLGKLDLIPTGK